MLSTNRIVCGILLPYPSWPRAKHRSNARVMTKPPVEVTNPEAAAIVIDAATDPFASIRKVAEAAGLPKTTAARLVQRLKTRYAPLHAELTKVKTAEIIELIDDRLHRALLMLDELVMGGASAKDLAVITGILTEKSQLLKGLPTANVSIADAKSLDETARIFTKENIRRGLLSREEINDWFDQFEDRATIVMVPSSPSNDDAVKPKKHWTL